MKKSLFLFLLLSLFVACSSEKDTNPGPAPAKQSAVAPAVHEAITSLSGEYVLTETDSKKTKVGTQEYTCQTTHTYTLQFISNETVRYMAKTTQSIDPPEEGMMCASKLYNVDVTGSYEIKYGKSVTINFSSSGKIPWVDKGVMLLRLIDANTLEIVYNGSKFQKQ